ncbi:MAG: diadenylate cyclase [Halobacteria archaeon]
MVFPSELIVETGASIAEKCDADAILFLSDDLRLYEALRVRARNNVIFCVGDTQTYSSCKGRVDRLLYVAPSPGRWGRVRDALLRAVAASYLQYVDNVVCICPLSRAGSSANSIVCLSVAGELPGLGSALPEIGKRVRPEVFSAALSVALELATGGEDGHPIGTLFVLGDTPAVLKYSKPLSLNPFKGYAPFERAVTAPSCRDSIKQFAKLDGGFVVDRDGTIQGAGVIFGGNHALMENPRGLGTRHAAAAAITRSTKAVSIAVSASGGAVRVFMDGKIIEEIRPE